MPTKSSKLWDIVLRLLNHHHWWANAVTLSSLHSVTTTDEISSTLIHNSSNGEQLRTICTNTTSNSSCLVDISHPNLLCRTYFYTHSWVRKHYMHTVINLNNIVMLANSNYRLFVGLSITYKVHWSAHNILSTDTCKNFCLSGENLTVVYRTLGALTWNDTTGGTQQRQLSSAYQED